MMAQTNEHLEWTECEIRNQKSSRIVEGNSKCMEFVLSQAIVVVSHLYFDKVREGFLLFALT